MKRTVSKGWPLAVVMAVLTITFPHGRADDEALIVTPPGFTRPGEAKTAPAPTRPGSVINVRDRATGRPTPCRLNVVGPDGHFYQPAAESALALQPDRPVAQDRQRQPRGQGAHPLPRPVLLHDRRDRGRRPRRECARRGLEGIRVPARGEERRGGRRSDDRRWTSCSIAPLSMAALGYHSGDPHLHFDRKTEADDRVILDLLEAEDIQFRLDPGLQRAARPVQRARWRPWPRPSSAGWAKRSVRHRGETWIASGQEYRSSTYGHLNLFWRDDLVLAGQTVNADNWPLYGGARPRDAGSRADSPSMPTAGMPRRSMPTSSGRTSTPWSCSSSASIGGSSWPTGITSSTSATASPASGRAITRPAASWAIAGPTFIPEDHPDFAAWLKAAAEGRSFVTSGPMLLLEVNGERPGGIIRKDGTGPHRVRVRVHATCEVAPIQAVQTDRQRPGRP